MIKADKTRSHYFHQKHASIRGVWLRPNDPPNHQNRSVPSLISLDLDGTSNQAGIHGKIDPLLLSYLTDLAVAGLPWVINSDRYPEYLLKITDRLPVESKPLAILSMQRFIYIKDMEGKFEPHHQWNDLQLKIHESIWRELSPNFGLWNTIINQLFTVRECLINDEVFSFRVPLEQITELWGVMEELISPWPDVTISGNTDWTYIVCAAFSKANLLEELAKTINIDAQSIITVGDGNNDIPMLNGSITNLVGCPSNACSKVKDAILQANGFIASAPLASGTMEVIRYYLN